MKRCANREKGEILLFCLITMVILVSVSSMLTIIVASRSTYVRKSADYNDNVLLLEDANIRYLGEFPRLQTETADLVVYYFRNGYFNKSSVNYVGYLPAYDKYLKGSIDSRVQRMMFHYFKPLEAAATTESTDPVTGVVTKTVDYGSIDVNGMANYLYAYLLTRRFQYPSIYTDSAPDISFYQKLGKITGSASDPPVADTVNGNITAKYKSAAYGRVTYSVPRDHTQESGLDMKLLIPGSGAATGIDYYGSKYAPCPAPPGMKCYLLEETIHSDLKLNLDEMHIKGVSHLKQTVRVKMPVPQLNAAWQEDGTGGAGGYYEVTFTLSGKIEPNEWMIRTVQDAD